MLYDFDEADVDVLAAAGLVAVDGDAVRADFERLKRFFVQLDLDVAGRVALQLMGKPAIYIDLGVLIVVD
jgi:hypothetical protein